MAATGLHAQNYSSRYMIIITVILHKRNTAHKNQVCVSWRSGLGRFGRVRVVDDLPDRHGAAVSLLVDEAHEGVPADGGHPEEVRGRRWALADADAAIGGLGLERLHDADGRLGGWQTCGP